MSAPASWESADLSKISAPIRGRLELGMRSVVSKRGFMNNLSILSEDLMTEASSGEYARQSMLWAGREYVSMTVESEEAITFADGATSQIGIFRAKYNEATAEQIFIQSARVCGDTVYLITFGLSNDTSSDTYGQYREIISSFSCDEKESKK